MTVAEVREVLAQVPDPEIPVLTIEDLGVLRERGWRPSVRTVLSPAWTTDAMSEDGRRKLREAGIAPPGLLAVRPYVPCPQCGSGDTEELTRFGSTSCKAMWRCRSCREPFDHFKAH